MSLSSAFSPDYQTARERFRTAAADLGWQLESHPLTVTAADGTALTVDVAYSLHADGEHVLVLSSGVHGVEGFFGSAVQLNVLEHWATHTPPPVKCILLHGLNPFGFSEMRRFDENNVDPNRNFLLPGESYQGSPPGYAQLDGLLNPRSPPLRGEPFLLKALWAIARHSMPVLRQTIAAGQYDFPRGLFYGGAGPSPMQRLLAANLPRWLHGSREVVHFDFHTGLGAHGTGKLLIDYALTTRQRDWLTNRYGAAAFEACDASNIAYDARGGLGRWCVAQNLAPEYLFACAEFGTYGPIQVLAGLRAENRAHHWDTPASVATHRAKQRLRELFCPASEAWRERVLKHSFDLIDRAVTGLSVLKTRRA